MLDFLESFFGSLKEIVIVLIILTALAALLEYGFGVPVFEFFTQ